VLFFPFEEFGLSGVLGDSEKADTADRVIYAKLIDLVEEGADGHFSAVGHLTFKR
jgi:hypothetical protein